MSDIGVVRGSQVEIAYTRHGAVGGWPVVLLHGFPYDPRCYDAVAPLLAEAGADVVVPYLRGYGPTRYVDADVLRSGAQAAFAHDLRDLVQMLGLRSPIACGFDWGGRAACVAALLWPNLLGGLVTVGGYNVHDVARMAVTPAPPEVESRLWYQWYLHSEHGRRGLERYRREIARQLWDEWSPTWSPSDGVFAATATSFDNPDFVDTVVHSYRHRYALVPGHPDHEESERLVATQPTIDVPAMVIDSAADPIAPPATVDVHRERFTRLVEHRVMDVGHNPPQEDPVGFVDAVRALRRYVA